MQDPVAKRRTYLLAKAETGSMSCIGLCLTLGFGLLAIAAIFGAVAALFAIPLIGPGPALIGLMVSAVTGYLAYIGYQAMRTAARRSDEIVYVPPVREQVAALPADEVLLRGADQPASGPADLLRVAYTVNATGSDELVRPVEKVEDARSSTRE